MKNRFPFVLKSRLQILPEITERIEIINYFEVNLFCFSWNWAFEKLISQCGYCCFVTGRQPKRLQ